MQKIASMVFNRVVLTVLLVLAQLAVVILVLTRLSVYSVFISTVFQILSILLLLYVLRGPKSASTKISWVVFILLFPLGAVLLLFMISRSESKEAYKLDIAKGGEDVSGFFSDSSQIKEELACEKLALSNMGYIESINQLPVRKNTTATYYSIGEDFFEALKADILAAKHYVFVEYFIIKEGEMWEELKALLVQKAQEGLDVRLVYDDLGCMGVIPYATYKELENLGVKTERYNPFDPILSISHNIRDHRKITVIDGYIGYTGGLNISDEYINKKDKLGHWKDTGIRLVGDAVFELTAIFLDTWAECRPGKIDYAEFAPHVHHPDEFACDGYVQCYEDTPLNHELLAQTVYLNILNQAKEYVYIYTPYLIADSEMMFGLASAAKRGVDVRMILPYRPDKWFVHLETQSSYEQLMQAGVKIYEYEPGFMHAKSFVSDDSVAIIGTINLDYRSLYHHLENGVLLYKNAAIMDMKEDFLATQEKSMLRDETTYMQLPIYKRFIGLFIKFFAPLM